MSAEGGAAAREPLSSGHRLGIVSALALLAATFCVASLLPTLGVAAFALVLVVVSAWLAPEALRRLAGWRVLVVLLLLGGVSYLGAQLGAAAGEASGWDPLSLALHIVMRVGTILLAVGLVAYSLPLEQFAGALERLGMKSFGFAFGVAVNSLPLALRVVRQTYHAVRLRRALSSGRLRALRLAGTTVVANMLAAADDTVAAAMARGYDPEKQQRRPLPLTSLDAVFAIVAGAIIAFSVYWGLHT
jgi:energy-coupling factor transporter transmembrane protein EcfT